MEGKVCEIQRQLSAKIFAARSVQTRNDFRRYIPYSRLRSTYPHPGFKGADTNRQTVHLEYLVSGKEYFECDGKKYYVAAGYSLIVPNHVNVSYYSDPKDPCTRLWFSVWGDYPDALVSTFFPDEKLIIRKCNLYNLFDDFLSDIKKAAATAALRRTPCLK